MGLRLRLMDWWMPEFIIRRELTYVADHTTIAIQSILSNYGASESLFDVKQQNHLSIEEIRANMAQAHAKLVETLEAAFGHEKGVALGRETLFEIGQGLGQQTRSRLGVRDNPNDLIKAATILYRIFGIEFHIEWLDKTRAKLIIDRCALAEYYSPSTCQVLSATDEGIIQGLQPGSQMLFKEYMTNGCKKCKADIQFKKEEMKQ